MRPLTQAEYDAVSPLVAVPASQLNHAQLEALDAVYQAYTGAMPSDLFCDSCIEELHRRVKEHANRYHGEKHMVVPPTAYKHL